MVDQIGGSTEQQLDPYEGLDPTLVDEAYLTQAWWRSRHGEGEFGDLLTAEVLTNRVEHLAAYRSQIDALYAQLDNGESTAESKDEMIAKYRLAFEKIADLSTIEDLEKFIARLDGIKTGQPILDGDDVVFVADKDGNPALHVDEARDDELGKPQRYFSWKVEVSSGVPEKTTVLVDEYTPVGKEAIIADVNDNLSSQLRDSYLFVGDYERALAILTAIDAKDEIEELKLDARRSALNNFDHISPHESDTVPSRHLDLLSLVDPEAFQELLDRMAKRIANSGVPRTEYMIFYSALGMHQESTADDPFEEPYLLHAMFDLYESEHQRGIELEEQEKLAEKAKSFAH